MQKKTNPKKKRSKNWGKALVLFLFSAALVTSCVPDEDVPNDIQDRYLGTWNCEETTGINAPQFYTLFIAPGLANDQIEIQGLYSSNTTVEATIDGLNIDIPSQTTQGITISGSGQANADFSLIVLNFTANDGAGDDNVRAHLSPN